MSESVSPFLSVIIPAHNAAATLRRCLESLKKALTLATISHEILVIDDGSRDRTAKIAENLTRRIVGLRLIRHNKNQGCGPARNTGVAEAKGEFLWFVDADDEIPTGGFDGFNAAAQTAGCDIVFFRYDQVLEKNGVALPWLDCDARIFTACPKEDFSAADYPAVITSSHALWNKWFRRERVLAAGMLFPATPVNSDHPFTIANLCFAERMRFIHRTLYTYHLDASSISRIVDERRLSFLAALERTEDWLRTHGVDGGRLAAFHISKAHLLLLHFRHSGAQWRPSLREVMETYLTHLDREMVLRLAASDVLLPELKARLLEIHGLNPGLINKCLALRTALGNIWQRLRGKPDTAFTYP